MRWYQVCILINESGLNEENEKSKIFKRGIFYILDPIWEDILNYPLSFSQLPTKKNKIEMQANTSADKGLKYSSSLYAIWIASTI